MAGGVAHHLKEANVLTLALAWLLFLKSECFFLASRILLFQRFFVRLSVLLLRRRSRSLGWVANLGARFFGTS